MNEETNPKNHKLIESAFMAALKALAAEQTESLTTEVTIASGTYILSLTLKDANKINRENHGEVGLKW